MSSAGCTQRLEEGPGFLVVTINERFQFAGEEVPSLAPSRDVPVLSGLTVLGFPFVYVGEWLKGKWNVPPAGCLSPLLHC